MGHQQRCDGKYRIALGGRSIAPVGTGNLAKVVGETEAPHGASGEDEEFGAIVDGDEQLEGREQILVGLCNVGRELLQWLGFPPPSLTAF